MDQDDGLDEVLACFHFSLLPKHPISTTSGIFQERIHLSVCVLVLHRRIAEVKRTEHPVRSENPAFYIFTLK